VRLPVIDIIFDVHNAVSARDRAKDTPQGVATLPSLVMRSLLLQHGLRWLHPIGNNALTCVSHRAAEDDETLTEEEKAVLRFQQQRMKDAASDRSGPFPDMFKEHMAAPLCILGLHSVQKSQRRVVADQPGVRAAAYAGVPEPPAIRCRFALPDDDEGGSDGGGEGLTHMGRPLADVRDAFGAHLPRRPIIRYCADGVLTSRHVWTIFQSSPSEPP